MDGVMLDTIWQMFFGAYEETLGFDVFWTLIWFVLAFGLYMKTENPSVLAATLLLAVPLAAMFGRFYLVALTAVSFVGAWLLYKVLFKGRSPW